mgnify:FL=1
MIARGIATNEDLSVGLLDIDICGPSIPMMMGVHGEKVCASSHGYPIVSYDTVFELEFCSRFTRVEVVGPLSMWRRTLQ